MVAGPLVDYLTKWFARRNGGIYEPESRLIANIFALVFMAGGLGAWAGSTPYDPHWSVPVILYGVINFGQCIAAAAVATYLLDATKHNSAESFAASFQLCSSSVTLSWPQMLMCYTSNFR